MHWFLICLRGAYELVLPSRSYQELAERTLAGLGQHGAPAAGQRMCCFGYLQCWSFPAKWCGGYTSWCDPFIPWGWGRCLARGDADQHHLARILQLSRLDLGNLGDRCIA